MSNDISEEVRLAEQCVEQAEAAVATLLARFTPNPRAEKVAVSEPLETALKSLRAAHAALSTLRERDAVS